VSIAETVLVFAGIPAAIELVVAALVYGVTGRRTSKRYRPGRPFTFTPVWFVADGGGAEETEPTAHVVGPGSRVPALRPVAGRAPAAGEATGAGEPGGEAGGEPVSARRGPTGGASDRW
jgi:hypothetical protein